MWIFKIIASLYGKKSIELEKSLIYDEDVDKRLEDKCPPK